MILIWFTVAKIWGEFKHEVRQFQKPYDNQQAEQISSYGQIWCTSIRRFSCLIAPLLVRRLGI
ncbi:hypothetical protein D8N67_19730 [Acinetobacter baumannii]|nr:hypothetical protein [Acinetobacter baumannii]RKO36620.1 hypothetical protein D8N67_19730 [Acinetobacter baumannii]